MTYSINRQGEFKEKKVLDMQKYNYYDCGGSKGIDLKNKKNGTKNPVFLCVLSKILKN